MSTDVAELEEAGATPIPFQPKRLVGSREPEVLESDGDFGGRAASITGTSVSVLHYPYYSMI